LLSQQRPAEAIAKLEQAADLLPDEPAVAINLGSGYIMQRRHNKAVAILERASRLAPDNPMVWVNLAAAYLGRLEIAGPQQQDRAIQAYEVALRLDPQTPNVHYNLGLIYKDRRDWPRARRYFQQALVVNPADADARTWLGQLDRLEQEEAGDTAKPATDWPSTDLPPEPPG
jgi:tetratricopeptide (TPR) repeat protein